MKQIIIMALPALLLFTACNPKEDQTTQSNAIQYSKDIKPLEYDAAKFYSYNLADKGRVNADMVKSKLDEILSLTQQKGLRFIADTANDPESKYIGMRRADDASGAFEMNRITGRIIFNGGLKEYGSDSVTEGLPKDEEAIALSRRYFTQLKLVDNEKELSAPMISGLEMAAKKDGEKPQVYKKMVTVRYNRIKDGLPVEGATRLIFSFGKKAALTSLIADWGKWDATAVKQEGIVKPADIVTQSERKILAESGGAKEIMVTERKVVLYDDGQGTMEPAVYIKALLKYVRKGKDGKEESYTIPYDFYQPLMTQSVAVFPHVKDQQLKVMPNEKPVQTNTDTTRNNNDE